MILIPEPTPLEHARISAAVHEGLRVTTADGKPGRLAIVDEHGQLIEAGPEVTRNVWWLACTVLRNFLEGEGHIRVHAGPPGDKP